MTPLQGQGLLAAGVPSEIRENLFIKCCPSLFSTQRITRRNNDKSPLERVSLAFVERRINLYLRFGHPVRELRLDRWRRCAVFLPAALFCRVRWESNDYGTTRWQLIAGIQPLARLLLHAEGEQQVQSVLPQIDTIEALGIDPVTVSPAYWRTLGNRLSAHLPLPAYTVERHAAYLAGEVLR